MILGLLVLLFSPFPIFKFLSAILETFTYCLNQFVNWNLKIPGNTIDWIHLSTLQVFSIYAIIFSFLALLFFKKFKYVWIIVLGCIVISLEQSWSLVRQSNSDKMVFYSIKNNLIMDKISGLDAQLYSLDSIHDLALIKYQVAPNRLFNHLPRVQEYQRLKASPYVLNEFGYLNVNKGTKFLFLYQKFSLATIKSGLNTDVIVISNNAVKSLKGLSDYITFEEVILDSTNDYYYTKRLVKEAKELGLKIAQTKTHAISM
jgi:hypothetical protein